MNTLATPPTNQPFGPSGLERVVLESVPRVGFYTAGDNCPQDVPFPSCLTACLHYLGEHYGTRYVLIDRITWKLDNLYTFIMGTSGAAFRLSWGPGWQPDNSDLRYISADPDEPIRRAFEAVGYSYEIVRKDSRPDNPVDFRARIVESIRYHAHPPIAIGVVGPPEACVITGYEEHSDILMGWSFFQDSPVFNRNLTFEPSGYFRKHQWFDATDAIIFIGDRQPEPDPHEIYINALRWALTIARTPALEPYPGRQSGLAAYISWAQNLARDENFPLHDLPTLRARYAVHNEAVGTVADGRWYAAQFLKAVAEDEPHMAQELHAAASCYQAEHDLMWDIWALTGGSGQADPHVLKLADPVVRAPIAETILKAREQDAQAAGHIQHALDALALTPPKGTDH